MDGTAGTHDDIPQQGKRPLFSEPQPHTKRQRKSNWTYAETLSLANLYREKAAIIRGKFSDDGCSFEAKLQAWDSITKELKRIHPGFDRSTKECQRRWQTVLSDAKTKLRAYNKARNETGKIFVVSKTFGYSL